MTGMPGAIEPPSKLRVEKVGYVLSQGIPDF
jgi:hypothetical protein